MEYAICPVCISPYPPDGPEGLIRHILKFHRGTSEEAWIEQQLAGGEER